MGANKTRLDLTMTQAYGGHMMESWSPRFLEYRGMEHGPGWIGLVTTLHYRLYHLVGPYQIYQIKEKFGTLRYYCDAVSKNDPSVEQQEKILLLISDTEHRSETICEVCGHAGTLTRTEGWWKTRCGTCRDRENDQREKEKSSDKTD